MNIELTDYFRVLWIVTVGSNTISALIVLWFMQAVTKDAGFTGPRALLHWLHRLGLAALSIVMIVNAAITARTYTLPRPIDLLLFIVIMYVFVCSMLRHRAAPPVPPENGWHKA